jgi:hypothetical protein
LTPVPDRISCSKKIPVTRLINQIIKDYLEKNGEMEGKEEGLTGRKELQK